MRVNLAGREVVDPNALKSLRLYSAAKEHRQDVRIEFSYCGNHIVGSPLTVAKGPLEFVETPGGHEHLTTIEQALDRMEWLIEDMLTLAREGAAVGETESVALRIVATQAWDNVATNSASLEVESSVRLDADRSRLIQVFENR